LLAHFGEHRRLVDIEEKFAWAECGNRWGNSARVIELDRS